MTRAGGEHGPFAAPLHNRIRRRAGLKNPWIGHILSRLGTGTGIKLIGVGRRQPRRARASAVTRFISIACRESSQLMSDVRDIASTSEAEMPIRFR